MSREACMSTPEQIAAEARLDAAREAVMEPGCALYWATELKKDFSRLTGMRFAGQNVRALVKALAYRDSLVGAGDMWAVSELDDTWIEDIAALALGRPDLGIAVRWQVADLFGEFLGELAERLIREHWGE